MAYQQNNYSYRSNKNSKNDIPRNKIMTFDIQLSGTTSNGREYTVQNAIDLLYDLHNADTFSKLSVPVQISRVLLEGDEEAHGNVIAGFVKAIRTDSVAIDVTIYGRNVNKIENIDGLVVAPRVIVDRDGKVTTILGFDLIKSIDE